MSASGDPFLFANCEGYDASPVLVCLLCDAWLEEYDRTHEEWSPWIDQPGGGKWWPEGRPAFDPERRPVAARSRLHLIDGESIAALVARCSRHLVLHHGFSAWRPG